MTDPWDAPTPPPEERPPAGYGQQPPPGHGPLPPGYGQPPPAYGQPPPGYGQPPPGYGQPPPGYQQAYPPGGPGYGSYPAPGYGPLGDGPPGRLRSTGTSIVLFVVTFGIYGLVYNYQVHSEMKRHSGRGVGGGIALLLTFVAGVAMPFVTPAEVGSLYARRGEREPVNGWTGLWSIVPAVVGYIMLFVSLVAGGLASDSTYSDSSEPSDGLAVAIGIAALLFFVATVAGLVVWFVKTNGALNRYWESLGVR